MLGGLLPISRFTVQQTVQQKSGEVGGGGWVGGWLFGRLFASNAERSSHSKCCPADQTRPD